MASRESHLITVLNLVVKIDTFIVTESRKIKSCHFLFEPTLPNHNFSVIMGSMLIGLVTLL